jgi:hypothetical protein
MHHLEKFRVKILTLGFKSESVSKSKSELDKKSLWIRIRIRKMSSDPQHWLQESISFFPLKDKALAPVMYCTVLYITGYVLYTVHQQMFTYGFS